MIDDVNYIKLDQQDRLFCQKLVYFEYLEALEVIRARRDDSILTVRIMIKSDMKDASQEEDYERCQMYSDMLKNTEFRLDD